MFFNKRLLVYHVKYKLVFVHIIGAASARSYKIGVVLGNGSKDFSDFLEKVSRL